MKDLIRRILREQIMINERYSKSNTDEFIEKAKKVHGDKYTYDKVDYKGFGKKVFITCPKLGHGDFPQTPSEHLRGKEGCRKCYLENKWSNTDEFIEKARKVHGDKYTYDNVDYKGATEDVNITCKIHGDFPLPPTKHLKGQGCKKCYLENHRSNTDEFIEKAKKVHGDKYTYDKVVYGKDQRENVIITCPKLGHGDFSQKPWSHLQGREGCRDCYLENKRSNTDKFIENAKKVHGDKYTYDNVDYKGSGEKVFITCKKHGDFPQPPYSHLRGDGCPFCRESKGELMVAKLLNTLEIQFVREKKFEDCKNSKVGRYCTRLPFDFYLPEFNAVIEYDGGQHFEPIKFWGGEERYKKTQITDEIKNKYCKDNGIKMIRIPYTIKFDDILPLLKNELGITG